MPFRRAARSEPDGALSTKNTIDEESQTPHHQSGQERWVESPRGRVGRVR